MGPPYQGFRSTRQRQVIEGRFQQSGDAIIGARCAQVWPEKEFVFSPAFPV